MNTYRCVVALAVPAYVAAHAPLAAAADGRAGVAVGLAEAVDPDRHEDAAHHAAGIAAAAAAAVDCGGQSHADVYSLRAACDRCGDGAVPGSVGMAARGWDNHRAVVHAVAAAAAGTYCGLADE